MFNVFQYILHFKLINESQHTLKRYYWNITSKYLDFFKYLSQKLQFQRSIKCRSQQEKLSQFANFERQLNESSYFLGKLSSIIAWQDLPTVELLFIKILSNYKI